ncbi:MAG: YkvA family protein [Magnetospirillum sp.]|nr:YkvA family protein [Magnetospirillum sp.]
MITVSSDRFWDKVRRTAGKVPFIDQIVAIWFCAMDPATPTRVKAILLGAVAYFVLPFDVVPDLLVGLGYADDLAVLMGAWRAVQPHVTDAHRAKARQVLDSGNYPA